VIAGDGSISRSGSFGYGLAFSPRHHVHSARPAVRNLTAGPAADL